MINGVEGYYWNVSNCSVVDTANYGIALTSEQMKSAASFDKFDFEKIWTLAAGAAFPTLKDVPYVAEKKDSAGFFGSELERYVPSDNPGPRVAVKPSRSSVVRMAVPLTCRYEQGAVHVSFATANAGTADVRIFNLKGREVGHHSSSAKGYENVSFDASRWANGRYLAVLRLNGKIAGKKSFIKK